MRVVPYVVAVAVLGGLGCSAPVVTSGDGDAEAAAPSTAFVLVERTISGGTGGDATRAEAVARFVRMRAGGQSAVDEASLRLVGVTLDFPELGQCASLPTLGARSAGARAVDLLDVGAISVEVKATREERPGSGVVFLQPRRLPEIVDLVSGVVYSTRATDPDALAEDALYVVRASGRPDQDLGGFVATATAPSEPAVLTFAGQDAKAPGGVSLSADGAADLVWAPGSPQDFVYVDVNTSAVGLKGAVAARTVRCLFTDEGHASLSASVLEEGEGTLTLHRVHRENFQSRGIEAGEIRFDFARVVPFHR